MDQRPEFPASDTSGDTASGANISESQSPEKIWTLQQLAGFPFGRTRLSELVRSGELKAKRSGKYVLVRNSD